ncbi:aspartate carbamoyltransferase 3 protein [Artemisia annua]|uniref:Aspartate carbamoyltransferase 3 protein n=1 Tax=Artemisia annua TaxID=35608 RepID=A0A2U1LKM5_ARTAN|nr:aspartate carbamoyltransferase 3 protein [Artemisia annua]
MSRLGGEVLTTENAREFSSAAKGETLEDTIRTVEGYSDIRHFESDVARRPAMTANIPVINAGDGPGQHPTQLLGTFIVVFKTTCSNAHHHLYCRFLICRPSSVDIGKLCYRERKVYR